MHRQYLTGPVTDSIIATMICRKCKQTTPFVTLVESEEEYGEEEFVTELTNQILAEYGISYPARFLVALVRRRVRENLDQIGVYEYLNLLRLLG